MLHAKVLAAIYRGNAQEAQRGNPRPKMNWPQRTHGSQRGQPQPKQLNHGFPLKTTGGIAQMGSAKKLSQLSFGGHH
jgi:hypothetical protein